MACLSIRLFGSFCVTLNDRSLTGFVSDKARALLAYLAIEANRPHRRETLADLLWPDRPEEASRANLRQTLHRLREQIDVSTSSPPYLLVNTQELRFNNQSNFWLDVGEYTKSLAPCQCQYSGQTSLCANCLVQLQYAIDLYKGDLLTGFSLSNCPDFEWWLLSKQEQYHRQAIETLDRLFLHSEKAGDYYLAQEYCQRSIELEPWREKAHRQKMRALALSGQRCAAIQQYKLCREILAKELNVEPSPATTLLYKQIRGGAPPDD